MALSHNLRIHAGATFRARFDWIGATGAAVDLTGWQGVAQVRSERGAAEVLLAFTTDAGSLTLGADGGIDMHLTQAQTAEIAFANGVWDLLLRSPDGDVHPPLLEGRVTVIRTVSQWPA